MAATQRGEVIWGRQDAVPQREGSPFHEGEKEKETEGREYQVHKIKALSLKSS